MKKYDKPPLQRGQRKPSSRGTGNSSQQTAPNVQYKTLTERNLDYARTHQGPVTSSKKPKQQPPARPQLATKAAKRKSLGFLDSKPEITRESPQIKQSRSSLRPIDQMQSGTTDGRTQPQAQHQQQQQYQSGNPRTTTTQLSGRGDTVTSTVQSSRRFQRPPTRDSPRPRDLTSIQTAATDPRSRAATPPNKTNRSMTSARSARTSVPKLNDTRRNVKTNQAPSRNLPQRSTDDVALTHRQVSVTFNPNKPKEVKHKTIDKNNPENNKYIGIDSSQCKYISNDANKMVVSEGLLYKGKLDNRTATEVVKAHMAGAAINKSNPLKDDSISFYESEYSQASMDSTKTSPKRHARSNRNKRAHTRNPSHNKKSVVTTGATALSASPLTQTNWVAPTKSKRQKEAQPTQNWDENRFQKFVEADNKPNAGQDWNFRLV